MPDARVTLLVGSLLAVAWLSVAGSQPQPRRDATHEIAFHTDDPEGQLIARKLLAKDFVDDKKYSPQVPVIWTAWVKLSESERPYLFVQFDCSGDGNCALLAYEPSKTRWRKVLDSIAQTCSVMGSSHLGRRDIRASMHGSAFDSMLKTYWWQANRSVRVSEKDISYCRQGSRC